MRVANHRIPVTTLFRPLSLGQVPATPGAALDNFRALAKSIRDNRALLAEAFQKLSETNDPSWNAKVDEYDAKVLQLVGQARAMVSSLSPADQPIALEMIKGNFDPSLGVWVLEPGAAPGVPATPTAPPTPAPGVVCKPTAEGGQVCSDGTCYAPGGAVPVTAAEAPSSFPIVPLAIGGGLAAVAAALWYFFGRK